MRTLWNDAPASPDQLAFLGLSSYGHYTFFQARRRTVHGLGLHLQRLRSDSLTLFGAAPTEDRLRELLDQALPKDQSASVRVTVVSRDADGVLAGATVEPEVVITVSDARAGSTVPITVQTAGYCRETPGVKHRATYGLVRHTRAARLAGFDDALFVDERGNLSEGSTWNTCLRADGVWVWPEAEVLQGVTMRLLRTAMDAGGVAHEQRAVPLAEVEAHQAAFALNATSATKPIARIDDHQFANDGTAAVQLQELWASVVPEPL